MRVLVPATPAGLNARVLPAILAQGYTAAVVPCNATESYYRLVFACWAAAQDFAIVEHDVEPHPGDLAAFDACPEPWCAHSYEVFSGDVTAAYGGPYALGLCRFRRELMLEHPDAVTQAGGMDIHPVHPPRSYAVMDSTLTHVLRSRGLAPHQHYPNAVHHHTYLRDGAFLGAPVGG